MLLSQSQKQKLADLWEIDDTQISMREFLEKHISINETMKNNKNRWLGMFSFSNAINLCNSFSRYGFLLSNWARNKLHFKLTIKILKSREICDSLVFIGVISWWRVTQWVSRAPPNHTFLNSVFVFHFFSGTLTRLILKLIMIFRRTEPFLLYIIYGINKST